MSNLPCPKPVAIVPVKRFSTAKMRLAPAFSAHTREQLAIAMLHDTLDAIRAVPDILRMLVVTGDPVAARIAEEYGAEVVADNAEAGTNAAVAQGLAAARLWSDSSVILPADLPCLCPAAVGQIVLALKRAEVVIATTADGGTATLALQQIGSIETAFGFGSFERHLRAAQLAGLVIRILDAGQAFCDLDTPDDLAEIRASLTAKRTKALLDTVQ